jgi:hypothetical protein
MSSNTPHPLASTGTGTGADIHEAVEPDSENQYSPDLQVFGNLFALCTADIIRIWDWHSGTLQTWLWLPSARDSGLRQFTFISHQSFMVVSPATARIALYEVPQNPYDPRNPDHVPYPKVELGLPPGLEVEELEDTLLNTDPVTRYSGDVKPYPGSSLDVWPFLPSDDSRIRVLTFRDHVVPRNVKFHLAIKNSWLVELVAGRRHHADALFIPWSNWVRRNGHLDIADPKYSWIRYGYLMYRQSSIVDMLQMGIRRSNH